MVRRGNIWLLILIIFSTACGSRKKTVHTTGASSTQTIETVGVYAKNTVETKGYGERLQGSLPAKIFASDSVDVVFESKGGSLTLSRRGDALFFDTEAKATTVTTSIAESAKTHQQSHAVATESTKATESTRRKWSLPWYVWLILIAAIGWLAYRLYNKIFKLFDK